MPTNDYFFFIVIQSLLSSWVYRSQCLQSVKTMKMIVFLWICLVASLKFYLRMFFNVCLYEMLWEQAFYRRVGDLTHLGTTKDSITPIFQFNLLTFHVGSIIKFVLYINDPVPYPMIDNVIVFLSRNNIQHLVLEFPLQIALFNFHMFAIEAADSCKLCDVNSTRIHRIWLFNYSEIKASCWNFFWIA